MDTKLWSPYLLNNSSFQLVLTKSLQGWIKRSICSSFDVPPCLGQLNRTMTNEWIILPSTSNFFVTHSFVIEVRRRTRPRFFIYDICIIIKKLRERLVDSCSSSRLSSDDLKGNKFIQILFRVRNLGRKWLIFLDNQAIDVVEQLDQIFGYLMRKSCFETSGRRKTDYSKRYLTSCDRISDSYMYEIKEPLLVKTESFQMTHPYHVLTFILIKILFRRCMKPWYRSFVELLTVPQKQKLFSFQFFHRSFIYICISSLL